MSSPDHYRRTTARPDYRVPRGIPPAGAVILILDTIKAQHLAFDQFRADMSAPFRLRDMSECLKEGNRLYIPMVHFPIHGDQLEFSDGRHRAITLAQMGFSTLPVLTSRLEAEMVSHLWAETSQAFIEYDFVDDEITQFVGN